MKQIYHSNSTTNVRLRKEINTSKSTNLELSKQIGVSKNTISKWKNRTELTDKSSCPLTIKYALSSLEMLIAIELRNYFTWSALDEITEAINPLEPQQIRSALYRTFVREGINKVTEKEKAKKFKEYDPGYLHIDVTYLPKINGIKHYSICCY